MLPASKRIEAAKQSRSTKDRRAVDDPQTQDAHPRTVGGYRLLRSLGRGGFGEVFLGETEDGARAAVKVLHANWAGEDDMRRRFSAEVEQARKVSGFCVAAIVDADPEAAEPWIATEYIEGPTLQNSVIEHGPRRGTDLHRLAVSTARALSAIHSAGVGHRDLKPDNIMLAADGPRVIDFGIARAVESTSVTASGVIGTIVYMAPEQLEGTRLSPAVDIFAWGSVMVFAATGREAFPGPTQAARIARILGGEPELEGLAEPLLSIVRTCLDKDATRRPDASALLNLLISAPAEGRAPEAAATGPTTGDATEHTEITPSPHAATRVGVDRTRVDHDASDQVPATKVDPPARVDPTRTYTKMAGPEEHAAHAEAVRSEPVSTPSTASGPDQGRTQTTGSSSVHRDGVPPYHFLGVRFVAPGALAEAMQQNWNAALRIFSDTTERAALGAWIMDDLGDTLVDRSLFRRQAGDANLTLAAFIAQLRPDLPPVFRGRVLTVEELTRLFADPTPVLTGAPQAGEMALLARPEVLRIMGAHDSDRPGEHQSIAGRLDAAERAGQRFQARLTKELNGWKSVRTTVNPALILSFLLAAQGPGRPDSADPGVAEWIDVLWTKVESAPDPENAGYAAVIYGALPVLATLARQRRDWEGRYGKARGERATRRTKVVTQDRLSVAVRACGWAILGLPVGFFVHFSVELLGNLLMWIGLLAVFGKLGTVLALRIVYGSVGRRTQRIIELQNLNNQIPQLKSGVDRIRGDLERAQTIAGS